jgi:hypothetical protein
MRLQLNVICDEAVPYVVPIIKALAMSTTLETIDVCIVWRSLARLLFIDVQQSIESMLASSQTLQHFGLVVQCTNKFSGDGDNEAGEMCQDANLRKEELFSCLRCNFSVIECEICINVSHPGRNKYLYPS